MLDEKIRKRFELHIKHGGLITAPEKLLAAVLEEVAAWLQEREREYRRAESFAQAETLRDLRSNDLKETRT